MDDYHIYLDLRRSTVVRNPRRRGLVRGVLFGVALEVCAVIVGIVVVAMF